MRSPLTRGSPRRPPQPPDTSPRARPPAGGDGERPGPSLERPRQRRSPGAQLRPHGGLRPQAAPNCSAGGLAPDGSSEAGKRQTGDCPGKELKGWEAAAVPGGRLSPGLGLSSGHQSQGPRGHQARAGRLLPGPCCSSEAQGPASRGPWSESAVHHTGQGARPGTATRCRQVSGGLCVYGDQAAGGGGRTRRPYPRAHTHSPGETPTPGPHSLPQGEAPPPHPHSLHVGA